MYKRQALRVASNKNWRRRGARGRGGWTEGRRREGGGMIRNRQRDAPRNEGITHLKVAPGKGNVGVGFAGELYCQLCTQWGMVKAKLQSKRL